MRRSVRGEYQIGGPTLCASAPSHRSHAMPPRRTRNSDRPRASDRTMVATESNRLPSFKNRRTLSPREMKPREPKSNPEKNLSNDREAYLQTVGWISRQKSSRLPAEGEAFLLTSPFIEPPISKWNTLRAPAQDYFVCKCGDRSRGRRLKLLIVAAKDSQTPFDRGTERYGC